MKSNGMDVTKINKTKKTLENHIRGEKDGIADDDRSADGEPSNQKKGRKLKQGLYDEKKSDDYFPEQVNKENNRIKKCIKASEKEFFKLIRIQDL